MKIGMTPREAIIELDRLKADVRIPINKNRMTAAINVARAALQKQIPQKPINLKGRCGGMHYSGNCPVCAATANSSRNTYCRKCGQKLDWD